MTNRPWIAKRNTNNNNFSNTKFYVSKEWRALRQLHIRLNPLCVECLKDNKMTDCTAKGVGVVDHIQPIRLGGKALDVTNLQTLCKYHHGVKTQKETR